MTAPGDFTSGDVLTAADMNDLPAGILAKARSTGDFTCTTSGVNILSATFTVPASRVVILLASVPLFSNSSTTNEGLIFLEDDVPASATEAYGQGVTQNTTLNMGSHIIAYWTGFSGTHTVYLNGYSSTGTVTANGNASTTVERAHTLLIIDGGPA